MTDEALAELVDWLPCLIASFVDEHDWDDDDDPSATSEMVSACKAAAAELRRRFRWPPPPSPPPPYDEFVAAVGGDGEGIPF